MLNKLFICVVSSEINGKRQQVIKDIRTNFAIDGPHINFVSCLGCLDAYRGQLTFYLHSYLFMILHQVSHISSEVLVTEN